MLYCTLQKHVLWHLLGVTRLKFERYLYIGALKEGSPDEEGTIASTCVRRHRVSGLPCGFLLKRGCCSERMEQRILALFERYSCIQEALQDIYYEESLLVEAFQEQMFSSR